MARLILGSITELRPSDTNRHAIVGSHCGILTGEYAVSAGVASLIAHDAGVGCDNAGIAGLALLDDAGIPAATASHLSARIGDPNDMLQRGVVSHLNESAKQAGLIIGMPINKVSILLGELTPRKKQKTCDRHTSEHRFRIPLGNTKKFNTMVVVDSASLVCPEDEGAIVITGSHGGLPGAKASSAIKAKVKLAAFNDAGIGIENAGISRLEAMNKANLAGIAVDAWSARIGDGRSTYETGVISHANEAAFLLGARKRQPVKDLINLLNETA